MKSIGELFQDIAAELIRNSVHAAKITPENVFQHANLKNRVLVQKVVGNFVLPQSLVSNAQSLIELGRLAREGKSCLILMEHYSNFDLPTFFYVMEQAGGDLKAVASQIIAMAGMKLNEEQAFVRAYTEAYSRIVIYPSRSMEDIDRTTPEGAAEIARARLINRSALHQMVRRKHEGNIILVFPAGTRYRPGDPSTKRGLREIDSYIKSFDYFLCIGIAGNCLRIMDKTMIDDIPVHDVMVFHCDDKVTESKDFRTEVEAMPRPADADLKQFSSDQVMVKLDVLHCKAESIRSNLLPKDAKDIGCIS